MTLSPPVSFLFLLFFSLSFIYVLSGCEENPYKQGKILYQNFCANCHMEDGSGLKGVIPPLAKSDYLAKYREKLPCIVRYGIEEPIAVNGVEYNQPMAGIDRLSEFEIANILNYINNAWGNESPYMSIEEVRKSLNVCQPTN